MMEMTSAQGCVGDGVVDGGNGDGVVDSDNSDGVMGVADASVVVDDDAGMGRRRWWQCFLRV
jgi:hypothetical protein